MVTALNVGGIPSIQSDDGVKGLFLEREQSEGKLRIAIMGSGGIGSYFGARLQAAGEDVTFIARGAHLEAMRANGLNIKSTAGDLTLSSVDATSDPSMVGAVDLILFTVKLFDTEEAANAVKPLCNEGTTVLSLQNGIESGDILRNILRPDSVLTGAVYIVANIERPGVIRHLSAGHGMEFGETGGLESERCERIAFCMRDAGIEASATSAIEKVLWKKFLVLASWAGVASVMRGELELIRRHSRSRRMLKDAVDEVVAVGRANGAPLSNDDADEGFEFLMSGAPPNGKPSMLVDLELGKKLELPWLSGAVTRYGGPLGVKTPVHNFIYAALEPYINGHPAAS